jgi:hypothetical protein
MTAHDLQLGRRSLLAGAAGSAAVALAGCSGGSPGTYASSGSNGPAAQATPSQTTSSPTGSPTVSPVARLPTTRPWEPSPAEISPHVKVQAVRLLEAVGAWPAGQSGLAAARRRAVAAGYPAALADELSPLLSDAPAAAAQVVDAQYGGILSASSSVLVVLRQWMLTADGRSVSTGGTTVDVRLVSASPRWRVTVVYPAQPKPPDSALPAVAAGLLAQPRLRLPVAARADVRSGTISPLTMATMRQLSREHVVDVSVVRSGHPLYVFGTNRLSDHPRGHAFDIWAIDGRTVLDPANRALTEQVMRRGIALGAWQVGGPVDLDGGGSLYFSDNTHHDHIHMGFHG